MTLIMPKQDGRLETCLLSIEVYKENGIKNFVTNDLFKLKIKEKVKSISQLNAVLNDGPGLLKKNEIARYFGLIDYSFKQKKGKLNNVGLDFYNHPEKRIDIVFDRMKNISFGKNNAATKSNSEINPPILFLKLIDEFNSLNMSEFAYFLYLISDENKEYLSAIEELVSNQNIQLNFPNRNKFLDCKFPIFFKDLGIVYIENKRYFLNYEFREHLDELKVFSNDKNTFSKIMENNWKIRPMNEEIINSSNNRKPSKIIKTNSSTYTTDRNLKLKVFFDKNFMCEIDQNHTTFQKENGVIFMEGHHLIPMKAQDDFENNLDRVENIVCLCPNCHRKVHHARRDIKKKIFENMFIKKNKDLKACGFKITSEEIFKKYYY